MYALGILVRALLVAAVTAALAAPAWGARPFDPSGSGAVVGTTEGTVRPDDRPGTRGAGSAPAPVVITYQGHGFDWGDAGVGAAGSIGLIVLAGAAVLVVIRSRRRVAF
jgi:hypothetical protein